MPRHSKPQLLFEVLMRKLLLVLLLVPFCVAVTVTTGCGKEENKVVPLPDDYDEAAETAQEEAELETTQ